MNGITVEEYEEALVDCQKLHRLVERAFKELAPLVAIADAFDANGLDGDARKFWGIELQHAMTTSPDRVELYTGRGGAPLLNLGQCLRAREFLRLNKP